MWFVMAPFLTPSEYSWKLRSKVFLMLTALQM